MMSIQIDIRTPIAVGEFATLFDDVDGWTRLGQINSANYGDGHDFMFRGKVPIRFYDDLPNEPFLAVEFDRFDDNPKDLQAEALASLSHILKQHGIQFDQEWSTSSRTEPRVRGPVDGDVRHIKSLAYV